MNTISHTCEHCGSLFTLNEHSTPMRDKDSISCSVCKKTLISWNGGVYYSRPQLVREGPNPVETPAV